MRLPRFSTATLLLAIAFAAIVLASVLAWQKIALITLPSSNRVQVPVWMSIYNYAASAPFWVPVGFLGYAFGRKRLSVAIVVALAITQTVAFLVEYILLSWHI